MCCFETKHPAMYVMEKVKVKLLTFG